MFKYTATLFTVLTLSISSAVLAQDVDNCEIQFAVSTPPMQTSDQVLFNITSPHTNNSLVMQAGSSYKIISNLRCTDTFPYYITASVSLNDGNSAGKNNEPIGQCILKAGPIYLSAPGNSLAVVFPEDFYCNTAPQH